MTKPINANDELDGLFAEAAFIMNNADAILDGAKNEELVPA